MTQMPLATQIFADFFNRHKKIKSDLFTNLFKNLRKSAFGNLRHLRAIIPQNYEKYISYWHGQSWLIGWYFVG
jgi:hypothetical protein